MKLRQYILDVPQPINERVEAALKQAIERGLLPPHVGPADFLLGTVLLNGLAMVESDLKQRERNERRVLLPDEVETKWQKQLKV